MSAFTDNLIAFRLLYLLMKPFNKTEAYKLGIIDDTGKLLKKMKDLSSQDERNAYNYLTRFVFNVKRILNRLPGGESKIKNLVASVSLIKENYQNPIMDEWMIFESLIKNLNMIDKGILFVEEIIMLEHMFQDSFLTEDTPANSTGAMVSTDIPVVRKRPRVIRRFIVNDTVYNKFKKGKEKFKKWSEYLNLDDEGEKMIYDFARKNHRGIIILHNGDQVKAIRYNRRGGGKWAKISRNSRKKNNG
jgi:hypothetical protein